MKHHLEQLDDEIYMGFEREPFDEYDFRFASDRIGWSSKRAGKTVDTPRGKTVPVFIKIPEVQAEINTIKYQLQNYGKHAPINGEKTIECYQKMIDKRTAL